MNIEITELADLIQKLSVSIAVVIGGIWTLFTFKALNLKKKAEAELRELEHKLSFEAKLNIDIVSDYVKLNSHFILKIMVKIQNVGTRDTIIYYVNDRKPLSIVKITDEQNSFQLLLNNKGDIKPKEVMVGVPYDRKLKTYSKGSIIRPGETVKLPFIAKLQESGVYFLVFSAIPKVEVFEKARNLELPEETLSTLVWTSRDYVLIE